MSFGIFLTSWCHLASCGLLHRQEFHEAHLMNKLTFCDEVSTLSKCCCRSYNIPLLMRMSFSITDVVHDSNVCVCLFTGRHCLSQASNHVWWFAISLGTWTCQSVSHLGVLPHNSVHFGHSSPASSSDTASHLAVVLAQTFWWLITYSVSGVESVCLSDTVVWQM